jgi:hypothetical protein
MSKLYHYHILDSTTDCRPSEQDIYKLNDKERQWASHTIDAVDRHLCVLHLVARSINY